MGGVGARADTVSASADALAAGSPRPDASIRGRIQGIVGTVFVVGAICFGAAALWSRREEFASALASLSAIGITLSAAFSLVGVFLSAQVWMRSIRAVGGTFDPMSARNVFFATQVGKYLPGLAWPYLAQLRFAGRFGLPKTTMAAGQAVFLAIHLSTGAALSCLALPWLVATDRVPDAYLVVLAPAAALALALHPRILRAVVNGLVLRHRPDVLSVDSGSIIRAIGWMNAVWFLYGAALAALVVPITADPDHALLLCLGGFAFAWVVGFWSSSHLPGRAREVVLIGVLSALVSPVQAAAVAVASRVIMTMVDLGLGAVAATAARRDLARDRANTTPSQKDSVDVS